MALPSYEARVNTKQIGFMKIIRYDIYKKNLSHRQFSNRNKGDEKEDFLGIAISWPVSPSNVTNTN